MIEFNNEQDKIDFDDELRNVIIKAVNRALEFEKFMLPCEVNVVITDNAGIRGINREHRKIDRETDVLSFPMLELKGECSSITGYQPAPEDINPENGEVVLGDIVLSLEKALAQSQEYGHSFEREIAFLTTHSVLHLLGYDHELEEDRKVMRKKEELILKEINLPRFQEGFE